MNYIDKDQKHFIKSKIQNVKKKSLNRSFDIISICKKKLKALNTNKKAKKEKKNHHSKSKEKAYNIDGDYGISRKARERSKFNNSYEKKDKNYNES